jgi:methyl-accepting chemotaxis protein
MLLGSISLVLLAGLGLIGYLVGRSVTRQLGGEPSMVVDIMQRVADGDLTVSAGQVKEGSLLHSLDRMVAALRQIVGEINRDANTLVNNAQQIATASDEVAKAAEHQSDATSAMAAAIEQLTVSSNHISDSARETSADSARQCNYRPRVPSASARPPRPFSRYRPR